MDELRKDLFLVADAADAVQMSAYMKGHFPFLGVKSANRKAAAAPHISAWLKESKNLNESLVMELWNQPEREFQYIAMEYVARTKRYWQPEHLQLFETLICQKSWWDTVDFIAATLVGGLLQKYPELQSEMDQWNRDADLWKVRTSLLYQLKYKDEVDFEALSRYILAHAESKEFFLRKASGWALRQYSKFNPELVRQFIASHELSPLTVREGSKYL